MKQILMETKNAIDPTIIVAAITVAGSIIVAIITTVKNRKLDSENKKLETKVKEIKLITTGMVVAYFFSFIKPLFENLTNADLYIKSSNEHYSINSDNIRLELMIPKSLGRSSFKETKAFYDSSFRGGELLEKSGRVIFKNVKYRIDEGSKQAYIIIDMPSILETAVKYYSVSLWDNSNTADDLIERELTNFKTEIERIVKITDLDGKVFIKQV